MMAALPLVLECYLEDFLCYWNQMMLKINSKEYREGPDLGRGKGERKISKFFLKSLFNEGPYIFFFFLYRSSSFSCNKFISNMLQIQKTCTVCAYVYIYIYV